MATSAVTALKDGRDWLASQAGNRTPRTADRYRADNVLLAALKVLATSNDWPRYSRWFERHDLVTPFQNRQQTFVTKKWNRMFCKFLDLAISDLEALPRGIGLQIGRDTTSKQRAALAKARSAKAKRATRQRVPNQPLQTNATPISQASVGNSQTPVFIGSKTSEIATFGV